MFSSDMSQYDLPIFDNNSYCDGDFGIDGLDYLDPSNVAGPSQPQCIGVDVLGDLNSYPDFVTHSTAPSTRDLVSGLHEYVPFYQDITIPPTLQEMVDPFQVSSYPPLVPPSFVPTLSRGSLSLSPESSAAPPTPTRYQYPRAITNPGGLDFGFPIVPAGPSLSMANSTWGGLLPQFPPLNPSYFDSSLFDPITGFEPPEVTPSAATASSSGLKRTRQRTREARRCNPLRTTRKKVDHNPESEGWNRTLVRFRAYFDTLYSVYNGQPSGGLAPETALASSNKFVKEDLKRSPLCGTKAGEGKRSRDVEAYLEGLLQAIRQEDPASVAGGESDECDTTSDVLSRLADELEGRLLVVNQQSALRQSTVAPEVEEKLNDQQMEERRSKNDVEKARRHTKRFHIERISRLFRASNKRWPKKDVLSLATLFLLYGPGAFPQDFVQVRHAAAE